MEINISKGKENYSQRNNVVCPNSACGPTNFIQALDYAGWEWDNSILPEYTQPEDKLIVFTRTNKDVLAYYKKHYTNMYNNWVAEAKKVNPKKPWLAECIVSFPPNEVHDVMNYAVNLFLGFTAKEVAKQTRITNVIFYKPDAEVIESTLNKGLPIVTSVNFKDCGHYVTIVGYNDNNIIVDNTYGKFDFVNKKYIKTSGDDEQIPRDAFFSMVKPVYHVFMRGAATIC